MQAYIEAWKLGLKAIAIYRDGCKRTQPLNTAQGARQGRAEAAGGQRSSRRKPCRAPPAGRAPVRSRTSSPSRGHEGYITVGMYEDGTPGEIFIVMAKEGSIVSGLMDCLRHRDLPGAAVRRAAPGAGRQVQPHPLRAVSGFTGNPEIPIAKSITDYIFRWLALKFLPSSEARRRPR